MSLRHRPTLCVAALALLLAGCSSASEVEDKLAGNEEAAPAPAAQAPAQARNVQEETEDYSFEFAYPAQVAAIPALRQEIDAELEEQRSALAAESKQAREEAEESGFPYNAYAFSRSYEVVADLPRFLSLSVSFGGYSGGAHGYRGSGSLVWDRDASRALAATAFFASPAALESALGERYCEALNRERAERREGYEGGSDMFDECVGIESVTVLLGSSGKQKFDRIGLIADPYVAGPWAEGSYEVTLPVDKALIATVKPEYRRYFAIGG